MTILREYHLGDMLLTYLLDDEQHVGMQLIPYEMKDRVLQKNIQLEPLVQIHARGDQLTSGYGNGSTMAATPAADRMTYLSQEQNGDTIITTVSDGNGRVAKHFLSWREGTQAVRVSVAFENQSEQEITLDLLSSLNFGGLTPFTPGVAVNAMRLHRVRSSWAAEGLLETRTLEELSLEAAWAPHAMRVEKFGQLGSMPVRGFFPFAAIEDYQANVTWALQLAWPGSWQIELRRKGAGLSVMTGLPDEDYGHWAKIIQPGESFHTPEAYFTVGIGGVDPVSQRLQDIHRENWVSRDRALPVLFNEYCTTWGNPTHENIVNIVDRLRGRPFDYFVIDCGWYGREGIHWSDCSGDWIPNDAEMFPEGLKATMDYIHGANFKPGLWFEAETCSYRSLMHDNEALLLKRHGAVIDTNSRRFLDLRKEETHAYLEERVIGLMERCGIDYIKVDYNDTIGVGCDGAESLGEGLRQNIEGTLRFFRRMRERLPHLCIENCSSGGHRLEPAMMSVSDMASFSDAHECAEIPIIAAALHRLILPGQSQIWAVMQAKDSLRRINYSLINTFLGVMCISGDVLGLSDEQWAKVDEGIDFYREVRGVIRDGVTTFYGEVSKSMRQPEGWQALSRKTEDGKTLVVIHTFGGKFPEKVTIPVEAGKILRTMCSEENSITLNNNELTVELKANFEAVAVYLEQ